MDLVLQQPFPYKSLDFMHCYLQLYYVLNRRQKWALFWPLFALLSVKSVQYLVLSVYEPRSDLGKIVANDLLRLVGLPPETNLIVVGNLLIAGYYLHLNYFETGHKTVDVLAEVFNDNDNEQPSLSCSNFLISKYREGDKNKPLSPYIKRYCFIVLNLLQVFILAIDSYFFATQNVIISTVLFQSRELSLQLKVVFLILAELDIFLMYLALYVFSYSHMLLGTLTFSLLEIVRQLTKQLDGLLVGMKVKREAGNEKKEAASSLEEKAATFRREYTLAVVNISRSNRGFFSRVLMPLLLVNCPSNALLTITLINGYISPTGLSGHHPLSLIVQFLVVMTILEQFLCIFLIHSLLATLNTRLKALPRRYISVLYGRRSQMYSKDGNRRSKLHSHLFLSAFHTNKPYGFTYHIFGRISSFNFVKYLILYSELLMFVYKAGF